MEPQQKSETVPVVQPVNHGGSSHIKEISLVIGGLLVGVVLVFCYFLFLAPKPEPVVIEKIVENITQATSTPLKSEPSKSYNFRSIDLTSVSTSTLSAEDISTIEIMKEIVKKDPSYIKLSNMKLSAIDFAKVVITPTFNLVTTHGGGEPEAGLLIHNYVIDVKNKKVVSTFRFGSWDNVTNLGEGTFVFGFNSYTYGATSSFPFKGTSLERGLTYDSFLDDQTMLGDQLSVVVTATNTNSITYAIFEVNVPVNATSTFIRYKKVGERMFIIP